MPVHSGRGAAPDNADLLYGARAIADFLNLREPQVRGMIEEGTIPTFKVGWRVCALKSKLNEWFTARANAAANAQGGQHG